MKATEKQTLVTLEDARSYLTSLIEDGLMFHFEDGAEDCLGYKLTPEQCAVVDANIDSISRIEAVTYKYGSPLGFAMKIENELAAAKGLSKPN
ncbi:hypothetical protein ACFOY8_14260 [Thalassospira xianhensis]|uniref:Uncharacterized protein n=1 Tax=Thalassospira xianhensis MCCC 1A02616 TaxID=1177929 RepID=A0A367UJ59_9PROT|nr:hypothetical protein [Thalassospira xianhensis]RCK07683.1 hypothetical protein TH5_01005 [Thalassospira xianhensis MCCC 1A02616]